MNKFIITILFGLILCVDAIGQPTSEQGAEDAEIVYMRTDYDTKKMEISYRVPGVDLNQYFFAEVYFWLTLEGQRIRALPECLEGEVGITTPINGGLKAKQFSWSFEKQGITSLGEGIIEMEIFYLRSEENEYVSKKNKSIDKKQSKIEKIKRILAERRDLTYDDLKYYFARIKRIQKKIDRKKGKIEKAVRKSKN